MSNKMNNMKTVLIIGSFILIVAGAFAFFSQTNGLLNVMILALISVLFFLISAVFKRTIKDSVISNAYYGLGIGFILLTYLDIGFMKLFGEYFSFQGDGYRLFISSIFILIGILLLITFLKTKIFEYIHSMYISLIMMLFFLLLHLKVDYIILLLSLNCILLLISIIKRNYFYKIVLVIDVIIVSFIVLFNDISLLKNVLLSGSLILNSLFILTSKEKVFKFISLALLFFNIYITYICLIAKIEIRYVVLIIVFIMLSLELFISCFNLIKDKYIIIIYKLYFNISYILVTSYIVFNDNIIEVIISSFMFVLASIVINKVFKNNNIEMYLIPYKAILSIYLILMSLPFDLDIILVNVILNAVLLSLYYLLRKNKLLKQSFLVMLIVLIMKMIFGFTNNILYYFINLLMLLVNYYFLVYKTDVQNKDLGNIIYICLIVYMTLARFISNIVGVEFIIIVLLVSLLAYLVRNNKLCFGASMISILILIYNYMNNIFVDLDIMTITFSLILYAIAYIFMENSFDNVEKKDTFISILLLIWFVRIDKTTALNLFLLMSSIVIIIISLKNSNFKTLFKIGLIGIALSLIRFIFSFSNLSTSLYLLIIGVAIVLIIIAMMVRYKDSDQEKEDMIREANLVNRSYHFNYCPHCGKRIVKKGNFCMECGGKL